MTDHADIDHTGLTGTGGSVATDAIFDAAGDLVQGTGSNTAAKLSAGASGKVLQAAGATTAVAWKYPPGYEFDYVEKTSNTNITATTEASANTVLTANSVTYDGSTIIEIEWFSPNIQTPSVSAGSILICLFDAVGGGAAAVIGTLANYVGKAAVEIYGPGIGKVRITPTAAAHVYSIRAYVTANTGIVSGGSPGAGTFYPTFLRQRKVSGGA